MQRPFGVAVDEAGRILVADTGQRAIVVYPPGAGGGAAWKGTAQFAMFGPIAVGVDNAGKVYAVDGHRARVLVFDNNGAPIAEFGKDEMQRPVSIAINSQAGKIFVGDVRSAQILVYNLGSLKMEKTIGGPGAGGFGSPAQISVTSKGRIVVGDAGQCRVSILEADGALYKEFPTECGAGAAGRTSAVAVDRLDRIYVADSNGTGGIQVFDPEGKPLQLVRTPAEQGNEPSRLTGMAVDRDARLYILDQKAGGGRLRIFSQGRDSTRSSEAAGARRQR